MHLVGNARHRVHDFVADRTNQTGRRAGHLGHHRCALRHVGLTQVVVGHLPAAGCEHGAYALADLGSPDQTDAHDLGNGFPGDVVLGGAEPAAHDDGIAAFQGETDARDDTLEIVADLGLIVGVDTGERQLLAHPRGIGVDDLTEQQLGAHRDDFATHAVFQCSRD